MQRCSLSYAKMSKSSAESQACLELCRDAVYLMQRYTFIFYKYHANGYFMLKYVFRKHFLL